MNLWFINEALADTVGSSGQQGNIFSFIMMLGFAAVMYFVLWRPQSKRAKEHRTLLTNLVKGDEIITTGGIAGKISAIHDQYITITVSVGTDIIVQKNAIISVLPTGTLAPLSLH